MTFDFINIMNFEEHSSLTKILCYKKLKKKISIIKTAHKINFRQNRFPIYLIANSKLQL